MRVRYSGFFFSESFLPVSIAWAQLQNMVMKPCLRHLFVFDIGREISLVDLSRTQTIFHGGIKMTWQTEVCQRNTSDWSWIQKNNNNIHAVATFLPVGMKGVIYPLLTIAPAMLQGLLVGHAWFLDVAQACTTGDESETQKCKACKDERLLDFKTSMFVIHLKFF